MKENMLIDISNAVPFLNTDELSDTLPYAHAANELLHTKTGKGNEFLGWVDLPGEITEEFLTDIEKTAKTLQSQSEIVVVIGIGGSYLGAKAVIEALSDSFAAYSRNPKIPHVVFAGQNISEDYLAELRKLLKTKEYSLIVISKSGTTTEPALAFRILKQDLIDKYGKALSSSRIVAITDEKSGALRTMANTEGFKTYVVPDNVGGRYSVLTPVGLLPVAVAGFNIRKLVAGAHEMEHLTCANVSSDNNPATVYASVRNLLYKSGKSVEILVSYEPKLQYLAEWWKQLYGESDGKEGKGLFPAAVNFSADLHSMGQYIQEGQRMIFETVISVKKSFNTIEIPSDKLDLDGLNYIAGKRISFVNQVAEKATAMAHVDGGVPVIRIEIDKIDEANLGALLYFFEKACGIGGYLMNINPFDQPGVEAYKKNMFALLGKPGFEQLAEKLLKR